MRADPAADGQVSTRLLASPTWTSCPLRAIIVGKIKAGEDIPKRPPSKRQWRVKSEFTAEELKERRQTRVDKASGQNVRTFVAGEWTLEYDLAHSGLAQEVWQAAVLALADERFTLTRLTRKEAIEARDAEFLGLAALELEAKASHVYALFEAEGASKAIGAQYLAELLEHAIDTGSVNVDGLRSKLPSYVLEAIAYVTAPFAVAPTVANPAATAAEDKA